MFPDIRDFTEDVLLKCLINLIHISFDFLVYVSMISTKRYSVKIINMDELCAHKQTRSN